jgi:hypothetical protein
VLLVVAEPEGSPPTPVVVSPLPVAAEAPPAPALVAVVDVPRTLWTNSMSSAPEIMLHAAVESAVMPNATRRQAFTVNEHTVSIEVVP